MLTDYAKKLIARHDDQARAIDGLIVRRVPIMRQSDSIKLTAKAKALIVVDRSREQTRKQVPINFVIKRTLESKLDQARLDSKEKRVKSKYLVRTWDSHAGVSRAIHVWAVHEMAAKRQARQWLGGVVTGCTLARVDRHAQRLD